MPSQIEELLERVKNMTPKARAELEQSVLEQTKDEIWIPTIGPQAAAFFSAADLLLYGGQGNDLLTGGQGADSLYGNNGDDWINGGTDADLIYGNQGRDTLVGESGDDTFYGGQGADVLSGGAGNDVLFGNLGNDTISGGAGNDLMNGGGDIDYYFFTSGSGVDSVAGFDVTADILQIRSLVNSSGIATVQEALAATSDVNGTAVINLGSSNTITLVGVSTSSLSTSNFEIV